MEKVKIKISKKKDVELSFFGETIFVNPIIRIVNEEKIEEQTRLKVIYIESLIRDNLWDVNFAEFMFRRELLKLKTNIDIESLSIEDLDEVVWGEFYQKVSSSIINYEEVKNSILLSVSHLIEKMKIDSGVGNIITALINKFEPFINEISSMKVEDFEKLKASLLEAVEKVKEEPMASILSDMNKK